MAPRKNMDSPLEESPLLSNRTPTVHSTINPNKLDQARFTEIREMESEGSSLRIIIYVVIVIVVGVGLALLARNIITNQQATNTTTNTATTQPPQPTQNTSFILNKNPVSDTSALNTPKNTDYVDSAQVSLGNSTADATNTSLDRIYYTRYTTFARVTFDLTTADKKLPKMDLTFDSVGNTLTIAFSNLQTINTDLKKDLSVGDIVSEIRYLSTNNNYVIMFSDSSKYHVMQDGDNLVVDIKTNTELAKPETATTTTNTPTPEPATTVGPPATTTTTTDTGKPNAPHYDNSFSQDKQYVTSNVNTNKVADNVYYFDNYGSSYEFSWAQKDAIGDATTPNATAYYDTSTTGKTYLYVVIQNLSQEVLSSNGVSGLSATDIQNKTGATTSGTTFNRIDLVSFTNGTATYKLDVSKKSDYKLWVDKTADGKTGTVSVTIKD